MCTRPDLATIYSLLSSFMRCPSPGHLVTIKHAGKYILSTMNVGLQVTSKPNSTLESYIHFPLLDDDPILPPSIPTLNSFFDANWGPQDASRPSHTNLQNVSIENHVPYVVICSLWRDVLSFGKLTKKQASAEVPVKPK
jgi:hypothetical protein